MKPNNRPHPSESVESIYAKCLLWINGASFTERLQGFREDAARLKQEKAKAGKRVRDSKSRTEG